MKRDPSATLVCLRKHRAPAKCKMIGRYPEMKALRISIAGKEWVVRESEVRPPRFGDWFPRDQRLRIEKAVETIRHESESLDSEMFGQRMLVRPKSAGQQLRRLVEFGFAKHVPDTKHYAPTGDGKCHLCLHTWGKCICFDV